MSFVVKHGTIDSEVRHYQQHPIEVLIDERILVDRSNVDYIVAALLWHEFDRPQLGKPEWDTIRVENEEAFRMGCRLYRVVGSSSLNEVMIRPRSNEFMILDDNGDGDVLGVVTVDPSEVRVGVA